MTEQHAPRPEGVTGSAFPGPFPVGSYAALLRDELRKRARVQLFGEVFNVSSSRARVYFELRDGEGAVPCAMWRDAFDRLGLPDGTLVDGARVVVAGGPDYYPGSRTSSPSFSFDVTGLRVAGDGDLLAQLDALRRRLGAEGLLAARRRIRSFDTGVWSKYSNPGALADLNYHVLNTTLAGAVCKRSGDGAVCRAASSFARELERRCPRVGVAAREIEAVPEAADAL